MIPESKDNILDLLKLVKQQKLNYIFALWPEKQTVKNKDTVVVYTSFEKSELAKLNQAIQNGEVISDEHKD
jgi:hypothetical protein